MGIPSLYFFFFSYGESGDGEWASAAWRGRLANFGQFGEFTRHSVRRAGFAALGTPMLCGVRLTKAILV